MRLDMRITLLLACALITLNACDWAPGSTFSFSQSTRIWGELEDEECLVVGRYQFMVDMFWPPSESKQSIQLRPLEKEDQEFLPPTLFVNYYLNDALLLTNVYDLKKGKGSIAEEYEGIEFEEGDELEYEICPEDGTIPDSTEISVKFSYKFAKQF
jgi:hypothetical protein